MSVIPELDDFEFTVVPGKLTVGELQEFSEIIARERRKPGHAEAVRRLEETIRRYQERCKLERAASRKRARAKAAKAKANLAKNAPPAVHRSRKKGSKSSRVNAG